MPRPQVSPAERALFLSRLLSVQQQARRCGFLLGQSPGYRDLGGSTHIGRGCGGCIGAWRYTSPGCADEHAVPNREAAPNLAEWSISTRSDRVIERQCDNKGATRHFRFGSARYQLPLEPPPKLPLRPRPLLLRRPLPILRRSKRRQRRSPTLLCVTRRAVNSWGACARSVLHERELGRVLCEGRARRTLPRRRMLGRATLSGLAIRSAARRI